MRALPPPRKSRARAFKRFLHKLYRIITFQFLFHRKRSILVRRRRTPFHLSSRKYKVKLPKRYSSSHRNFWFQKRPVLPNVTELGDDLNQIQKHFPTSQIQFKVVNRRSRFRLTGVDRRYMRRLLRRFAYKLYSPRRTRGMSNLNVVVDIWRFCFWWQLNFPWFVLLLFNSAGVQVFLHNQFNHDR